MNLQPLYSLNDTIQYLHYKKSGKYNKNIGTIILIGGSSYKYSEFNKVNFDETNNFYNKFNHENKYPNINFQKELSKYSLTFSFDRPTDMLNLNLYSNENYKYFYYTSLKNLTIKNYAVFLYNLFNYHKLKPPFIIYGVSEGAYDALCFCKYYNNLVKKVFCVDSPYLEKYLEQFEIFRNNKKWLNNIKNKNFNFCFSKNINLTKNNLTLIDYYNYNIKYYNILSKLKINDFNFKNINFYIIWSPYHINKINKEKIKIQQNQNKELLKYSNINILYLNGPHQLERTFPLTLSKLIINSI